MLATRHDGTKVGVYPLCVQHNFVPYAKGCTYLGRQVARETKIYTMAPNICVSSMEIASCRHSGAYNLKWLIGFLDNLYSPDLYDV
jgi:hypothetical protein